MSTVVGGWTERGFVARISITILTGLAWAVRSVQEVVVHPDYMHPVTAADHVSVYAYSAAWLLTAASLLILREVARPSAALSYGFLVVAGACVVTGIANGAEDGLGLKEFGIVYVIGVLIALFGMFGIAIGLGIAPARRLAFVPAIGAVAMATMVIGGGVLGLVAWIGLAAILVRERRKTRTGAAPLPS